MTPLVVKTHSQVHMVMRGANGLQMLLEGKALENGRLGDKIRVQNHINPE